MRPRSNYWNRKKTNELLISAHNWRSKLNGTPYFNIIKDKVITPCDALLKNIYNVKRNYYKILNNNAH